ncbi:MAG: hypothetical protein AB8B84_07350 [Granulosicoccus sp.]
MQSKKRIAVSDLKLASTLALVLLAAGCSSSNSPLDTSVPEGDAPADDPTETPPQDEDPNPQEDGVLNPEPASGSDSERLLKGIQRQVASTLIELNTKLRQGETLSQQEENCLGAFDPAVGEQLLAINCEQSLVTSPSIIRVERASYYNTAACQTGLSTNNSDDCILQSAILSIPTQWITPDAGIGASALPQPIAGMEIFYTIDNTMLRIESSSAALTGLFQCDLELTTLSVISSVGQSCSNIISTTADRLDALIPGI